MDDHDTNNQNDEAAMVVDGSKNIMHRCQKVVDGSKNFMYRLIEQVEFANIMKKVDLVQDKKKLHSTLGPIQTLNPSARVVTCHYGVVDMDVNSIVNTKAFSLEEAATSPGWLQSLTTNKNTGEEQNQPHGGEAEEYGICMGPARVQYMEPCLSLR
jgi:G3E family GTPase